MQTRISSSIIFVASVSNLLIASCVNAVTVGSTLDATVPSLGDLTAIRDIDVTLTTDSPITLNSNQPRIRIGSDFLDRTNDFVVRIDGNGTENLELCFGDFNDTGNPPDFTPGTEVLVTWVGNQPDKNDVDEEFSWTQTACQGFPNPLSVPFNQEESRTLDIPSLGWEVTNNGQVFLVNSFPSPINFSNLAFQTPDEFSEDTILEIHEQRSPDLLGFVTSGTISSAVDGIPQEFLVGQFPLNPGDFLTMTFESNFVDSTYSIMGTSSVLQTKVHEHQSVSESDSNLSILVLGILGISFCNRHKHNSSKLRVGKNNKHPSC